MQIILASLSTLLLGVVLTLIARAASPRLGMVAAPRPDRWHQKPTPMLGGVAIYAAFGLGFLVFAQKVPGAYAILGAGSLLFLTGLVDDAIHIKPYAKLVLQMIAASTLVFFGLHLPWGEYVWINDVLTIFWLVGITN